MLVRLHEDFVQALSRELEGLSDNDKRYFYPHKFDLESVRSLLKERGNYYFVYLDDADRFAGYGMLRTFDKYALPTLGCVIWERHRMKGNGEKLTRGLIAEAWKLGFQHIKLTVAPDNTIARNLYAKAGFKEISDEDGRFWGARIWMTRETAY